MNSFPLQSSAPQTPRKKSFLMQLRPGSENEYELRHNPIPEELADALRAHGVRSYSIFLDRSRLLLFAYLEYNSDAQLAQLPESAVCQRWWAHMAPLMDVNPDLSPVRTDLRKVFDLTEQTERRHTK